MIKISTISQNNSESLIDVSLGSGTDPVMNLEVRMIRDEGLWKVISVTEHHPIGRRYDFYQVYLSAVNEPDTESGLMKSKIAVDKYTTKNLRKLQDMDDSGADYFFAAQDIFPDWLDHINITHEHIKEYSADLKLYLGLGNSLSIYDVHLVMKNSQWLLDSVKSHSRKTETCY